MYSQFYGTMLTVPNGLQADNSNDLLCAFLFYKSGTPTASLSYSVVFAVLLWEVGGHHCMSNCYPREHKFAKIIT